MGLLRLTYLGESCIAPVLPLFGWPRDEDLLRRVQLNGSQLSALEREWRGGDPAKERADLQAFLHLAMGQFPTHILIYGPDSLADQLLAAGFRCISQSEPACIGAVMNGCKFQRRALVAMRDHNNNPGAFVCLLTLYLLWKGIHLGLLQEEQGMLSLA